MKRRGVVLLVVLVVAALVAVIALGLMFRVRAETSAAAATERGEQAWYAAMSGVSRMAGLLQQPGADPKIWYDNPDALMNQLVVDDGRNRWYFTVWAEEVTSDGSQGNTLRYGATDEAGKINVNTAAAEVLQVLPNMTSALVDCLIDYREPAREARPEGAEQDYYDQLDHPYQIANCAADDARRVAPRQGLHGPHPLRRRREPQRPPGPQRVRRRRHLPARLTATASSTGVCGRWPRWSRPSRTSIPAATPASTSTPGRSRRAWACRSRRSTSSASTRPRGTRSSTPANSWR